MNEVLPTQAAELNKKVHAITTAPSDLTLAQLKEILTYTLSKMGLGDMYNSTREYVSKRLIPLSIPNTDNAFEDSCYGLKKRDTEDVYQAIYLPGAFKIEGVASTQQVFEDGGVLVEQNGDIRGVQPEIFVRTYCLAGGQPIKSVEKDLRANRAGIS